MTNESRESKSPPPLSFSITPKMIPYGKTVSSLQVIITNTTDSVIVCSQFVIDLKIGSSSVCISEDASAITMKSVTGSDWIINRNSEGQFAASVPTNSQVKLNPRCALSFIIRGITTNSIPGLTTISVCGSGSVNGVGFTAPGEISLAKVPAGTNITGFTANPVTVPPDTPVNLEWVTIGAIMCTLSSPDGKRAVAPNGMFTVLPAKTTSYTLTATDRGHSVHEEITVVVE